MLAVLERENLRRAMRKVRSNGGAAGVDGLDIDQTSARLATDWPEIREQLAKGTYRPAPVRRVTIPKPGGGERELGVPTVTDRLVQQALLQVLQPILDPGFSEHSYGFRPGRSAQMAVLAAQRYVQSGLTIVVDVDLEKFFDRVDHDILIDRLRRKIPDPDIIRLVRAFLDAGVMDAAGEVTKRRQGTPQGGPLSPLLANLLLDEVDKDLERRGHAFCRYADDCNVYVRSLRAGERVMAGLRRSFSRLHLTVNETKSAVASVFNRKFLGYALWRRKTEVRRKISAKAIATFKDQVRALTRRTTGRALADVVERLACFMRGWKAYFRLTQATDVLNKLDAWIRRRIRAIQLKQWGRPRRVYRALIALGLDDIPARRAAAEKGGWWRRSIGYAQLALTNAWAKSLGLPQLA